MNDDSAKTDDERDRQTCIGALFVKNIEKLKSVHEVYFRRSSQAAKCLLQIQETSTVMLWLNECKNISEDLTSEGNLDILLIQPVQRISIYPDIITRLLCHTLVDHPDHEPLTIARATMINTIDDINRTKKNFDLVSQILSKKHEESGSRNGVVQGCLAKPLDKTQASNNRPPEEEEYTRLHEKFGDDYLRLHVVVRDIEYYTRTVSNYTNAFLKYLSSVELFLAVDLSKYYAHLESKWFQFNTSMKEIKTALEKHVSRSFRDFLPAPTPTRFADPVSAL